ncbi:MAG: hypothetical protein LBG74_03480 [Spirochaetaceae bacterium]|jgi:hypothetical protein|nr:hypothetical protein [Spirochaetaceae bacterium]
MCEVLQELFLVPIIDYISAVGTLFAGIGVLLVLPKAVDHFFFKEITLFDDDAKTEYEKMKDFLPKGYPNSWEPIVWA